jgi:hypothetical protein
MHIRRHLLRRARRVFEVNAPRAEDDVACSGIGTESDVEISLVERHHATVLVENPDGRAACFDEVGQECEQTLHAIPQLRIVLSRLHNHSTHLASTAHPTTETGKITLGVVTDMSTAGPTVRSPHLLPVAGRT